MSDGDGEVEQVDGVVCGCGSMCVIVMVCRGGILVC